MHMVLQWCRQGYAQDMLVLLGYIIIIYIIKM